MADISLRYIQDLPAAGTLGNDDLLLLHQQGNEKSLTLNALAARFLTRQSPFADIKSDGTVAVALSNLGIKSAALRDVGVGAGQIPDITAFLSLNADTGYQKLPSGIILQWGLAAGTLGVLAQKLYPIAFPNAALHVLMCHNVPNDTNGVGISGARTQGSNTMFEYMPQGIKISGTTVTAAAAGSAAISMHFLAIGY